MKKKTSIIFILIIVLIGFFNLANNGRCVTYAYVWYFNTDKDIYYNDEEIYINASWDLDYEDGEISYIQIRIFNESWDLLWNSPQYHQNGSHLEGEWYVKISELDLPFNNTSNDLIVVFFYYLHTGNIFQEYLEVRYIQAIKRDASCELIDFKQNIIYGDLLQFKARFYSSENNSNLANHLINVKIMSNKVIHYTNNFTTNSSGMIEIVVPTSGNIMIGKYNLTFEVIGDKFYYNSTYEYPLSIGSKLDIETSTEGNNSKEQDSPYSNVLPIIFSILSISLLAFLIVYHSVIKKTKQKDLADLTFKF